MSDSFHPVRVCNGCGRLAAPITNGLCAICFQGVNGPPKTVDAVNHPPHYTHGKIEPIDAIEDWKLGFCLGNVVKYIARSYHKGNTLEDLKKARWYLDREIASLSPEKK